MKTNRLLAALGLALGAFATTAQTSELNLDHAQVENIVRRSYQFNTSPITT